MNHKYKINYHPTNIVSQTTIKTCCRNMAPSPTADYSPCSQKSYVITEGLTAKKYDEFNHQGLCCYSKAKLISD